MQKGEIETLKQVCLSILAIGAICTRQLNIAASKAQLSEE
ncbi:uncharacterized protein FPRO_01155 [Fusarium proliferatum ET1]|uniref:Uncharacterized protein n=1 Tax=Fusarium proliferatum (strain ET1) TaxID=1227346 RepID=A0A1L7V3R3_FUSPR|nr:uncharacterized protein FPRO_01155 [Fusarium proliferatum ET1]CZR34724.1 uncharacterized protein FPRO_01155 [Fusarium proliferatum ET1]